MDKDTQLDLYRWLCASGTSAVSGDTILEGFCERLERGGVPLIRAVLAFESLDPTIEAMGFRWTRKSGIAIRDSFARPEVPGTYSEEYETSPFFALLQSPETSLRRRLDREGAELEFPMFAELKALGATEYVAIKTMFTRPGAGEGTLCSFTTDHPGGFTDAHVETLCSLMPGLQLAAEAMAMSHAAETVLATYLGRDTSKRVLAGAVDRGVAHALDAILWASDLAGFTRLADTEPQERVIDLLNAYVERTVGAIEDEGGEVLKFTGDGMLAFFDRDKLADAPRRALDAATKALADTEALSVERAAQGLPISRLRVALHSGELFYGNIGSRSRLDFTVIGPAVNEAARLCDMCKSVDRDLVVSATFHETAPALHNQLVGLGRYGLRGVARPQHLYTLDAAV